MSKPKVIIYTDGGAEPNPGPGGWGAVLLFEKDGTLHKKELKGGEIETTNNRMEITAATEALKALKQPCEVEMYTDSQYLQKGITEWMILWKKNNFKKGKVQNVDLWKLLDSEVSKHEIHWQWVKAHAANEHNERADLLAAAGRAEALGKPASEIILDIPYRLYLNVSGSTTKPGLWVAVIDKDGEETLLSGQETPTHANRLYLLAAVAVLEAIPENELAHLFTNSDYLRDGIKGWVKAWKRNKWLTKEGTEVKHRDLWEKLEILASSHKLKLSSIEADHPKIELLAAKLKEIRAGITD